MGFFFNGLSVRRGIRKLKAIFNEQNLQVKRTTVERHCGSILLSSVFIGHFRGFFFFFYFLLKIIIWLMLHLLSVFTGVSRAAASEATCHYYVTAFLTVFVWPCQANKRLYFPGGERSSSFWCQRGSSFPALWGRRANKQIFTVVFSGPAVLTEQTKTLISDKEKNELSPSRCVDSSQWNDSFPRF